MAHAEPLWMNSLSYDGSEWRKGANAPALQAGPLTSGGWKVTRSGTADHRIQIVQGTGYVPSTEGAYRVATDAIETSNAFDGGAAGIAGPPGGTTNRIDRAILRVYDPAHEVTTLKRSRFEIVSGASLQAVGIDLDDEANKPAIPARSLLLADLLIRGGSTFLNNTTDIRDRRSWAKGLFWSEGYTGGNLTVPAGNMAAITGGSALSHRYECTGSPLLVWITGTVTSFIANTVQVMYIAPRVDGVVPGGFGTNEGHVVYLAPGPSGYASYFSIQQVIYPAAGSRVIDWIAGSNPNSVTIYAAVGRPLWYGVQELPQRQTANND